jgi:multidrug efflux pump subunit AcrA (membrane-fusion protein)
MPERRSRHLLKILLLLPPVLLGIAVLYWQSGGRTPPVQGEAIEVARSVRVITVRPLPFVPRILGYGFVTPTAIWEGIAQVEGHIIARDEELERGQVMVSGSELLRIDPTEYELAAGRAKANLAGIQAQLAELEVQRQNLDGSLAIERRALELLERDHDRKRQLLVKGNTSQSSVDQAEGTVLAQRQQVQSLENEHRLIPVQRQILEANALLYEADLADARLDLERTVIRLPFAARIAEINVEENQFVSRGETLVVADSIESAEISVQVPMDRMRQMIPPGIDLTELPVAEISKVPRNWGFTATVRLAQEGLSLPWPARFDRVSDTIDPKTRTLGLFVVVDEPYRMAKPGLRPPLTKNMFVEVELAAPARENQIIVPRVAIHLAPSGQPQVFIAGADNRLAIRPVTLGPEQSNFVVVADGLDGGERVVVSDLIPAVLDMLLEVTEDEALAGEIAAQASGGEWSQ